MRMRKKKNLDARLAACARYLEAAPENLRGGWHLRAGGRPVEVEIGCGKGRFVTTLAQENPGRFFVAVERVPSVLVLAAERARDAGLENLCFIGTDARRLGDIFAPGEAETVYLNFSDPWPSARHAKRRLTHPAMLAVWDGLLRPGGRIIQKTDNAGLFEYSLCQLSQFGYRIEAVSLDWHKTGRPNIATEYESQFAARGLPIFRLEAQKPGPRAG